MSQPSTGAGGYASLSTAEQVTLLADVARSGARAFGVDPVLTALVRHAFNTTFRVETGPTANA